MQGAGLGPKGPLTSPSGVSIVYTCSSSNAPLVYDITKLEVPEGTSTSKLAAEPAVKV